MGEFYDKLLTNFNRYGFEVPYIVLTLMYFFIVWAPTHLSEWGLVWTFILAALPFVLPTLGAVVATNMWFEYKWQQRFWTTEHTVLEIRLPEEITQSPYAMELVLRALYQTGEVDTPAHEWLGNTRPWFSLEIVSTEGVVRFYMWTRTKFKEVVKAQIYAHYPTVQVAEVPDYTLKVPFERGGYDIFGVEYALQKPDPYPIATYVEQGLDKPDMKEEFKHDPMLSIIEFFGSIGTGENCWLQIIIRGHTECYYSEDAHLGHIPLEKWTEIEIDKLNKKFSKSNEHGDKERDPLKLSDLESSGIKAMTQKLNKQIFDVGIRMCYIARKEDWKGSIRNSGIPTAMRSFEHGSSGRGLNGLKPLFYIGPFNVRWHDFMGLRRAGLKRRFYRGYVNREYFYPPNKDFHIALNSEEIASLYHFPGKVAHTPTLVRMPSRRAEAPANLPTGAGPF